MRLLYFFDVFFWYLHKVTLGVLIIWFARFWWRETHNLKGKENTDRPTIK